MKNLSFLLVCLMFIPFVGKAQKIYQDMRKADSCYLGKWQFTHAKYRKNYGLHNIANMKKYNQQRLAHTESFKQGYITFSTGSVTFQPAGDTVIYKGKWDIEPFVHSSDVFTTKFLGKGAKYNMKCNLEYCPVEENGKMVFYMTGYKGFARYTLTKVEN